MPIILFPSQRDSADLPEGMVHTDEATCPFAGDSHPRGSTCCSFDATQLHAVIGELTDPKVSDFLCSDHDDETAFDIGLRLRDLYVNVMAYHHAAERRAGVVLAHPWTVIYERARSMVESLPDGSSETITTVLRPIGQVSEWFVTIGKYRRGVRAVRSEPGRE